MILREYATTGGKVEPDRVAADPTTRLKSYATSGGNVDALEVAAKPAAVATPGAEPPRTRRQQRRLHAQEPAGERSDATPVHHDPDPAAPTTGASAPPQERSQIGEIPGSSAEKPAEPPTASAPQ
jgi:hypothetical protein